MFLHKTQILLFLVAVAYSILILFSGLTNLEGASDIYNRLKIKSRAKCGYNNRGTVIYNYHDISHYKDSMSKKTLGNLEIRKKHVREIYNYTYIHGSINSSKENLHIGSVSVKDKSNIRKIVNETKIGGNIGTRGKRMNIGTIDHLGKIKTIRNRVEINGKVKSNKP